MEVKLPSRVSWIVGLGSTLGIAGQSAGPWIVSTLSNVAGIGIRNASFLVMIEMLAMGLTMLVIAPIIHRLPAKALCVASLMLIVVAQIMSTMFGELATLWVARAASGIAFGVVFSVATAYGALSLNPEKTYAAASAMILVIGTVLNPILGYASARFGASGLFLGIALYSFGVGTPLLFISFRSRATIAAARPAATAPVSRVGIVGIMAMMALLAMATNGVFVFSASIAGTVGLKGASLGSSMSLVSLVSSSGALLAGRLGTRLGAILPIVGGLIVIGSSLLWLTLVNTQTTFWIAFTLVVITYWFLYPYMLGLAITIDPLGRLAAATGSAKILAGAVGSGLAGLMASLFGFKGYGFIAFGCCLAAALISLGVADLARRISTDRAQLDVKAGALSPSRVVLERE